VSGYSIAVTTAAGLNLDLRGPADALNLAASGTYTDRPTITYQPLTGNKFVRGLMTPIPPESVLQAIQSGWALVPMFRLVFRSINGIKNTEYTIKGASDANPDFERVIELLRKLNESGMFAMRVTRKPDREESTVVTIVSSDATPEILATADELRKILGLDPKIAEYKLVQGNKNMSGDEIAVQTRSLIHIMAYISASVDVPEEHVEQGRAAPGWNLGTEGPDRVRPLVVHSSASSPADASVSVHFRNYYFFIDDRDLRSKRAFAFLMLLFTLADSGEREPNPVITIPAQ